MTKEKKPILSNWCERCSDPHYSVLGFTFPGEDLMFDLVAIIKSHPELVEHLNGDGWRN